VSSELAEPRPEPITSIGPSYAGALLSCGYRFAWDRDPSIPPSPSHPKALLGTIGHRVCEAAGKGRLGPVDDGWLARFDAAWKEQKERIAAGNLEHGEPERWPGYNLQRALWRNKAKEVSARTPIELFGSPDPSWGPEVPLVSGDGLLKGVADVVIKRGDEVEIRDFKSGRVLAETGELAAPYRAQLLLYGAMYEEMYGSWPSRLVIDPLVRAPIEVPADRVEAHSIVKAVSDAVRAFNEGIDHGNLVGLAKPSPGVCHFCAHTLRCDPFWQLVDASWAGHPRAFGGRVIDSEPGVLVIEVSRGSIAPGQWRLGGVPADAAVPIGSSVRVHGFEMRPDGGLAFGPGTVLAPRAE
jgi:PD-(D/E)XK nuclease superfamily